MNCRKSKINIHQSPETGFSFIELMIITAIVAILSSMSYISLSMRVDAERLKSTARAMENWINVQRKLAMQNNLTCRVSIDKSTLIMTSENPNSTSISCNPTQGSKDTFNIIENFGNSRSVLTMSFNPASVHTGNTAEILFSFRGFSENINLPSSGDPFEIRLSDAEFKTIRCIKIISPIGLIRDGFAPNNTSGCTYNNPV